MKKYLIAFLLLFSMFLFSGNSFALIIDNYIGADPSNPARYGDDVIGSTDYFDLDGYSIGFAGGNAVVNIYGNYFDNVGKYKSKLGDLFISTDGYNNAVIPTEEDYYYNGERWEYAVHLNGNTGSGASGDTAGVYAITDGRDDSNDSTHGDIILSDFYFAGNDYRTGQEVTIDVDGLTSLSTGSWTIIDADYLQISFSLANIGWDGDPANFAIHWSMTCANDVVEGPAVPEPTTMLLFGVGLIGLAGLGRKKFMK